MATKPKPKRDDAEQSRRFIDAAKKAGVDETGAVFDAAFERIIPARQDMKTDGCCAINSSSDVSS